MATPLVYSELEEIFSFVSWDADLPHEAFVCRRTGKIHLRSETLELDDADSDVPGDLDDVERYAVVPDKHELNLGKPVALAFVEDTLPHLSTKVRAIFSSRGAYARFKNLLEREGRLASWYEFEAQREKQALRNWCRLEGFELVEQAPSETGPPRPE